jgi:integrase/recombinase XerC
VRGFLGDSGAPATERIRQSRSSQTNVSRSQSTLRDQIALALLGHLGLRRNELRLFTVGDFDLARGTVRVHGKGGKIVILPMGFPSLKRDVDVYLIGRAPAEYLLYPKSDTLRPMSAAAVHRWFKKCLARAGLSTTIKMHELRHSAGHNLYAATGDIVLAKQLLRHESVNTTMGYLHPSRDDLGAALAKMEGLRSEGEDLA